MDANRPRNSDTQGGSMRLAGTGHGGAAENLMRVLSLLDRIPLVPGSAAALSSDLSVVNCVCVASRGEAPPSLPFQARGHAPDWNVGFLPQTWVPQNSWPEGATRGSQEEVGRHLEMIELGAQPAHLREVYAVKLLGAFLVVTRDRQAGGANVLTLMSGRDPQCSDAGVHKGRAEYLIVGVRATDPGAAFMQGLEDLASCKPGVLVEIMGWLQDGWWRASTSTCPLERIECITINQVSLDQAQGIVEAGHASWTRRQNRGVMSPCRSCISTPERARSWRREDVSDRPAMGHRRQNSAQESPRIATGRSFSDRRGEKAVTLDIMQVRRIEVGIPKHTKDAMIREKANRDRTPGAKGGSPLQWESKGRDPASAVRQDSPRGGPKQGSHRHTRSGSFSQVGSRLADSVRAKEHLRPALRHDGPIVRNEDREPWLPMARDDWGRPARCSSGQLDPKLYSWRSDSLSEKGTESPRSEGVSAATTPKGRNAPSRMIAYDFSMPLKGGEEEDDDDETREREREREASDRENERDDDGSGPADNRIVPPAPPLPLSSAGAPPAGPEASTRSARFPKRLHTRSKSMGEGGSLSPRSWSPWGNGGSTGGLDSIGGTPKQEKPQQPQLHPVLKRLLLGTKSQSGASSSCPSTPHSVQPGARRRILHTRSSSAMPNAFTVEWSASTAPPAPRTGTVLQQKLQAKITRQAPMEDRPELLGSERELKQIRAEACEDERSTLSKEGTVQELQLMHRVESDSAALADYCSEEAARRADDVLGSRTDVGQSEGERKERRRSKKQKGGKHGTKQRKPRLMETQSLVHSGHPKVHCDSVLAPEPLAAGGAAQDLGTGSSSKAQHLSSNGGQSPCSLDGETDSLDGDLGKTRKARPPLPRSKSQTFLSGVEMLEGGGTPGGRLQAGYDSPAQLGRSLIGRSRLAGKKLFERVGPLPEICSSPGTPASRRIASDSPKHMKERSRAMTLASDENERHGGSAVNCPGLPDVGLSAESGASSQTATPSRPLSIKSRSASGADADLCGRKEIFLSGEHKLQKRSGTLGRCHCDSPANTPFSPNAPKDFTPSPSALAQAQEENDASMTSAQREPEGHRTSILDQPFHALFSAFSSFDGPGDSLLDTRFQSTSVAISGAHVGAAPRPSSLQRLPPAVQHFWGACLDSTSFALEPEDSHHASRVPRERWSGPLPLPANAESLTGIASNSLVADSFSFVPLLQARSNGTPPPISGTPKFPITNRPSSALSSAPSTPRLASRNDADPKYWSCEERSTRTVSLLAASAAGMAGSVVDSNCVVDPLSPPWVLPAPVTPASTPHGPRTFDKGRHGAPVKLESRFGPGSSGECLRTDRTLALGMLAMGEEGKQHSSIAMEEMQHSEPQGGYEPSEKARKKPEEGDSDSSNSSASKDSSRIMLHGPSSSCSSIASSAVAGGHGPPHFRPATLSRMPSDSSMRPCLTKQDSLARGNKFPRCLNPKHERVTEVSESPRHLVPVQEELFLEERVPKAPKPKKALRKKTEYASDCGPQSRGSLRQEKGAKATDNYSGLRAQSLDPVNECVPSQPNQLLRSSASSLGARARRPSTGEAWRPQGFFDIFMPLKTGLAGGWKGVAGEASAGPQPTSGSRKGSGSVEERGASAEMGSHKKGAIPGRRNSLQRTRVESMERSSTEQSTIAMCSETTDLMGDEAITASGRSNAKFSH